jgi:hypothetical protein
MSIARNERAQLDGQIALRLNEARSRRDSFELHSPNWWYWKGKVEAHKTDRNLIFRAFKLKTTPTERS